jgi:hypothetical protein
LGASLVNLNLYPAILIGFDRNSLSLTTSFMVKYS